MADEAPRVPARVLREFAARVLERVGLPSADAARVAERSARGIPLPEALLADLDRLAAALRLEPLLART